MSESTDSSAADRALSEEEANQARKLLRRVLFVGLALAELGGVAGAWHGASRVGDANEIASTWKRVEAKIVDVRHRGTLRKPKTDLYIEYTTDSGAKHQLTKTKSGNADIAVGSAYEAYVSPADRTDLRHVSAVASDIKHGKAKMMRRGAVFGAIALPGLTMLLFIFGFVALSRFRS
jgi:hypothetical protein